MTQRATDEEKAGEIRQMFNRIAGRYDLMNRLMTLGRDQAWRRHVVAQADVSPGGRLLDVATGTGDIAFQALAQDGRTAVVGLDFAGEMLRTGRRRPAGPHVRWCQGDALTLPFPDASFDAVTSGYLLRNVGDLAGALREQLRVVRPGGRVVALDTTPPPRNWLRPLVRFHLRRVIPLLGRLVAGDAAAYNYLPSSTEAFYSAGELASIMAAAGLEDVTYRTFMLGTIAVHTGRRPQNGPLPPGVNY